MYCLVTPKFLFLALGYGNIRSCIALIEVFKKFPIKIRSENLRCLVMIKSYEKVKLRHHLLATSGGTFRDWLTNDLIVEWLNDNEIGTLLLQLGKKLRIIDTF